MNDLAFLVELQGLGIHLRSQSESRLSVRHRGDGLPPDIREEIGRRKVPLLELLGAREVSCREWAATLKDVAAVWNERNARDGDAPELPPEEDSALMQEVGDAMKACDLPQVRVAIRTWRAAWLELLQSGSRRGIEDRECAIRDGASESPASLDQLDSR